MPVAYAQESALGQAEYDLLVALVGEYTYEYTEVGSPPETGRIVFESFAGGRFLKFEESWDRDEGGTIAFGITESRTEAFGENDWAGPGIQLRTMWTDFSEDGWTFMWERSVDGGPWEPLSEGRNTRVR